MPALNGTNQAESAKFDFDFDSQDLKSKSDLTNIQQPSKADITKTQQLPKAAEKVDVLVAGSLAIDLSCDFAPLTNGRKESTPALHTSNPSVISQSLGGVGYNVALASSYVGSSVLFCSVVAKDISGHSALATLETVNKDLLHSEGVQMLDSSPDIRTAQYIAVNDAKKDLVLAMADMSILELSSDKLKIDEFWEPLIRRTKPTWAVIDANWSPEAMKKWISLCKSHGIKIAFEPVSASKATRLFSSINAKSVAKESSSGSKPVINPSHTAPTTHLIDLITPNRYELASMHAAARETGLFDSPQWWSIINALSLPSAGSRDRFTALTSAEIVDQGIPQQSVQLLPFMPCIVTKLGEQGVLVTQLLREGDSRLTHPDYAPYILGWAARDGSVGEQGQGIGCVYMRLFPVAEKLGQQDVVSVNGAGDTLLGVLVSALAMGEKKGEAGRIPVEKAIHLAQQASIKTLRSKGGVSPDIRSLQAQLSAL